MAGRPAGGLNWQPDGAFRMRLLVALSLLALVAFAPAAAAEPVGQSDGWPDCQGPIDTNCYDANSRIPFCYLYVVVLCIPDPI